MIISQEFIELRKIIKIVQTLSQIQAITEGRLDGTLAFFSKT